MSTSIEPKKVLQLINSMGYKNVSASELKQFTKDLKKLMKYEQKQKTTNENAPQVVHAPENVINVTIIKETISKKSEQQPTVCIAKTVKNTEVQVQTVTEADKPNSDSETKPVKQRKKLLRLPRHIRTKNPKIVYKTGNVNGVLVRNTPTDLFQKYQEDWAKFKNYIPGETNRLSIRKSIQKKMQHKDDYDAKVYVHFPDETGDH